MLLESLRMMLAYDTWANGRLFDMVAQLDAAQFPASGAASFGSVHDTLAHLISAQKLWLARLRGETDPRDLSAEAVADRVTMRAEWERITAATEAYLATLTDDDIAQIIRYTNTEGEPNAYPAWQLLFHMVNHAAQHRSEVATMLTQFGHSPGWLDFLYYLDLCNGTTVHDS